MLVALPFLAASAQLPSIEGILKNVSDIDVYYTQASLSPRSPEISTSSSGLRGFGFELLFPAGARAESCANKQQHRHRRNSPCAPTGVLDSTAATTRAETGATVSSARAALDSCRRAAGLPPNSALLHIPPAGAPKDTVTTPTELTIVVTRDTTNVTAAQLTCKMTFQVRDHPALQDTTMTIEVGLGYGQLAGFRGTGTLDLRGSVRELPTISVYATWQHALFGHLYPYLAVRTGLLVLQSVRAFEDSTAGFTNVYSLAGSAFQLGGVGGVAFPISRGAQTYFFAECYYMHRRFSSVEWASPGKGIPVAAPRTLNLSGFGLTAGLQIPLGLLKPNS
jgi:hypothetical protein